MKHLYIILLLLLTLTSCDTAVSDGRKSYMRYFHEMLKDPESVKIYSEKVTREGENGGIIVFDVEFGAKNSLGGYGRETIQFKTVGNSDMIWVNGNGYQLKSKGR